MGEGEGEVGVLELGSDVGGEWLSGLENEGVWGKRFKMEREFLDGVLVGWGWGEFELDDRD